MIDTNSRILKHLVNTCVNNDEEALREYEESIGKNSAINVSNSRGIVKWDIIYNKFINDSISVGFKAVQIHRGAVWTAVGVYVENTKELFLVFRKPNFKSIMKHPWRCHYATIANVANGNKKPKQEELFLEFEIENGIKIQYDNLAEDLFEKMGITPEKVILCSFTTNEFIAHLYNDKQQLVYDEDLSHLIEVQYNDLSNEQENLVTPYKERSNQIIKKRQPKQRIVGLKK
ncbi:DUF5986 family protein [Staphylococcus felis]|uniref:Uncharacterized protein n=1 Tax=Staphylococcus felis TaxID=46127 RepID=A0ABS0QQ90_9STAP|nr:DUF5986 family protein [Staphylococcus felis]MBH9581430.1 hypothetical protein [Staphylococcus felis]MDM8328621.1 DUF5986 family protein [Staphylococcus felis]